MADQTPFLDLDAVEIGGDPACEFKFMDREWQTRPKDDIPWGMLSGFLEAQASGDEGKIMLEIGPFFRAVMDPSQVDDFMGLTEASDEMTIKRFRTLLAFVAKAVFGEVPTERSSSSRAGSQRTEPTSRASSPSPVLETSTV